MARQLVVAAGVGAGAGLVLVAGFRAGAWLFDHAVDTYFRWSGWRDMRRETKEERT